MWLTCHNSDFFLRNLTLHLAILTFMSGNSNFFLIITTKIVAKSSMTEISCPTFSLSTSLSLNVTRVLEVRADERMIYWTHLWQDEQCCDQNNERDPTVKTVRIHQCRETSGKLPWPPGACLHPHGVMNSVEIWLMFAASARATGKPEIGVVCLLANFILRLNAGATAGVRPTRTLNNSRQKTPGAQTLRETEINLYKCTRFTSNPTTHYIRGTFKYSCLFC